MDKEMITLNTDSACEMVEPASCKEVESGCLGSAHWQVFGLNYFSCCFCERGEIVWSHPPSVHTSCLLVKTLSCYCCVSMFYNYEVNLFQN